MLQSGFDFRLRFVYPFLGDNRGLMSSCILCGSPDAAVTETQFGVLTGCPKCQWYTLATDLFTELPQLSDWAQVRPALSRVARWRFFTRKPAPILCTVQDVRLAILCLAEFEEDPELEKKAVTALVERGVGSLGQFLGLSPEEAIRFARALEARGKVKPRRTSVLALDPGIERFAEEIHWWERAEE